MAGPPGESRLGILPEGVTPGAAIRWMKTRRDGPVSPMFSANGTAQLAVDAEDDNLANELSHGLPSQAFVPDRSVPAEPPKLGGALASVLMRSADPAGAAAGNELVLEVRGLAKSFRGIRAVNGLDLDLKRGLVTALVGPNGAGKTTVFNLVTGAIAPDAGTVSLNGVDITGKRPDEIAQLGMVRTFQDVRVFPQLSVLDNVMLGIQHHPGERLANIFVRPRATGAFEKQARQKAEEWLDFVGLLSQQRLRAGALGFGQQKLLAIARVLATEAEVLLLDEPASAIDFNWVDTVLDYIELLKKAGRTICLVEHSLHAVGRLADHVYFMELGKVTAEGSLEELTSDNRLAESYFGTV